MELPPGPTHLIKLLPFFVLPSVTVYAFLLIFGNMFAISLSLWFTVSATLVARPILFIINAHYKRFMNKRNAALNNAVHPPCVHESTFSIISKLTASRTTGYPGDVMQEWDEQYGHVYQFDILADSVVVTHEPDHVKAILATQFDSFDKDPKTNNQMESLLGTGIFNVDGEMWKFHRNITRPFFTRERISDFEIYERNCDLSLKVAKSRLVEGYSIDFQDLVSRFTLDSATEFLFGANVGSLSAGISYPPFSDKKDPSSFTNHPSNVFVKGFLEGQILSALRYSFGTHWPLGPDFWSNKVAAARKVMDNFTDPLMKEALAQRERRPAEATGKRTEGEETNLLDHLVNHTQDPSVLKDQLINLLVAGRDTTMCLLAFSFYMLSEHPDIEMRLRQEVYEKVGHTTNPTYNQMRDMRYMRAFLNEVLRLYPPVPIDVRCTNQPVVLPNENIGQKPFYIPANTMCYYSVINMHRRTDLWGPDGMYSPSLFHIHTPYLSSPYLSLLNTTALTFDPSRFLDARLHKYLTPNPYIFCPFNAGPRICLGQQFAYHEATFYLVRLLQHFTEFRLDAKQNVAPPEEWKETVNAHAALKREEKVHPMSHLTMYIKGGLWVTMKEIDGCIA